MYEIVVISGKGGTGKTSITASFSVLAGDSAVIADCDVDASDMHLLLKPNIYYSEDFYSGKIAKIDTDKCSLCGICIEKCRFDAIDEIDSGLEINSLNCEGCSLCDRICPDEAIITEERLTGKLFVSEIKTASKMVHAKLEVGGENSGKLVAKVKKTAGLIAEKSGKDVVLVDGSPGIACPVISSLSGANFVVLVTEPSVSGFHDLQRVVELASNFNLKQACIINKSDLNPKIAAEIRKFLDQKKIDLLTEIPYDEDFSRAISSGITIIEQNNVALRSKIEVAWKKIIELLPKQIKIII